MLKYNLKEEIIIKKNEKSKPEERMKGLLSYLRINDFILNDTDFSEQVDIERTFVSAMKSGRRSITYNT